MKQTVLSALSARLGPDWWVMYLLAGLLPGLVQAQQPVGPQNLSSYAASDQLRFRQGAPVPAASTSRFRPGSRVLRSGVAVFSWLPAWVPTGYVRQVDFALLSHVACEGYQATEQGGLRAPMPGRDSTLSAAVHQANARCRVLVSVAYREPATGTGVFEAADSAARQALVQSIAGQVRTLRADGVNLDLMFQPLAVGLPPPTRPATKRELARNASRLNTSRVQLNKQKPILFQDSLNLVTAKRAIDTLKAQNKAIPPKKQQDYDRRLKVQQQAAVKFRHDLADYRKALALQKQGLLQPDAAPPTDERPAAVVSFVRALGRVLRQQHTATLTLSLPAVDSAQVYHDLPTLAPLVELFVLKAFDYTAGRRGVPGPLAPLQPSAAYGPYAVAASVNYYLVKQAFPARQLLVGWPSMGKLWVNTNPPADSTRPAPYQYLSNRSLLAWPRIGSAYDPQTGSLLVKLRPSPDSSRSRHAQPVPLAWAYDSASLAARYTWGIEQKLGGVGIWALGFDAPDAPIWNIIRANFTRPALPVVTKRRPVAWTPLGAVHRAETWVKLSPLAHMLVFGVVVLLAGVWAGLLLGAVARVRHWLPFPRRLALVSAALLVGAALLALYPCLLGQFSPRQLLVGWLTPLSLVLLLVLSYFASRPRELP